jgi:hypothetical protein
MPSVAVVVVFDRVDHNDGAIFRVVVIQTRLTLFEHQLLVGLDHHKLVPLITVVLDRIAFFHA